MVRCGTSLASLLAAGLLGNLALRGRIAGVASTVIVVGRSIRILIVIASVAANVVMRYTHESPRGQSPRTCYCSGSHDFRCR